MKVLNKLMQKPGIWILVGDANEGKSMALYAVLEGLREKNDFNLFTYGLRVNILNEQKIHSIEELEKIKNSLIVADEFFSLFDLEDRKKRKLIENSLRLINHNNNILILCGLPENFRKFISAKLDVIFFKKSTIADFVNGSRLKNIFTSYKGNELGSAVLNLKIDEALIFDGHYEKINIPYYVKYDTKKKHEKIIKRTSKCAKSVPKKVEGDDKNEHKR